MKHSCGFIIVSTNKVLICHPTYHPSNFFSIPKGKIEEGETEIEAAYRETFEETGLDLKKIPFAQEPICLGTWGYSHKKKKVTIFLFIAADNIQSIKLFCDSMVKQDGCAFPENDKFIWADFDYAIENIHYTQKNAMIMARKITGITK